MNCPNCGKALPQDASASLLNWCPFCGGALGTAAAQPPNPKPQAALTWQPVPQSAPQPVTAAQQMPQPPQAPPTDPQAVLTDAFRQIHARFGDEAIADGAFVVQQFGLMVPQAASFLPLVDIFARCGGNTELAQTTSKKQRSAAIQTVVERMTGGFGVHEMDARFICGCFTDAVPLKPAKAPKTAPVTDAKDKPKFKNGKMAVTIVCTILAALALTAAVFFGVKLLNEHDWDIGSIFSSADSDGEKDEDSGKSDKDHGQSKEDDENGSDIDTDESDSSGEGHTAAPSVSEGEAPSASEGEIPAAEADAPSASEGGFTPGTGTVIPAEEEEEAPEHAPSDTVEVGITALPNGNHLICNGLFSIIIPDDFTDHFMAEFSDQYIRVYEAHAAEESYGGHVFTVTLQDSDYTYYPAYELLGKLTTAGGKVYDMVVTYPTDVQYGEGECAEYYMIMYSCIEELLSTISPVNGCSLERQSTTSVMSLYINEMWHYDKFGKLWLHEDSYYSDGNNDPWDYDAIGRIDGPVTDNWGNTYKYGLHLDGSTVDPFYVTYELRGMFNTFSGTIILPESMVGTGSSKYIEIYCDGVLVFTSGPMVDGCSPQDFVIYVTGVDYLTIQYPATEGSNEGVVLCDGLLQ